MEPKSLPNFEVPAEMRDFAEKSVDQARKAFDGFLGAAQKTIDTVEGSSQTLRSSAQDMTRKTFAIAEQNISAAFDLAQKLARSKDVQEAMRHQAEYVKTQLASMQEQLKELGAAVQEGAQKTAAEIQKTAANVQKSAVEATKRKN
jgi:phasin